MDKAKHAKADVCDDVVVKEQGKEDTLKDGTSVHSESANKPITTSGDELRKVFSCVQCNLNVVHVNCQSISAHYMQMLSTFNSNTIDAILVSETFLKPTTNSDEVDLPGYTIIRNDRVDKGCGGVAIYLREHISYTIVDRSPNSYTMSAEHLFIEVPYKNTKVLLGVFYSPSLKINYFPHFKALLQKYRPKYEHVITLGDFNTDLLKNNSRSKKLLSIIDDQNLYILPLGPTHVAPHSAPSVLDLIIVSSLCDVAKAGQLAGCFSYHDILYLSYRLNFKNADPVSSSSSQQVDDLKTFWQSTGVRLALGEQLTAMKKYKSSRLVSDFEEYQKCRELVKKLETEFKREKRKCKIV